MVSEKEIEAAAKAIYENAKNTDERDIARIALTAAKKAEPAPASRSGVVKPLEWVASDDWEYRWTSDLYAIEDQGKNWSKDRYWLYYNGQLLWKFGTLDTALFVAQADYERRILSALTSSKPEQEQSDEHRYAKRLLIALMEKHYPDRSPEWAPLPDLMGVLTQIDNLTTGLVRATPPTAGGGDA